MKRRNWSEQEQCAVIRAYLYLLAEEQAGRKVNKAQLCRDTLPLLADRTRGSYEMKLMNISSAMVALGLPVVTGYKSYGNSQKSLTTLIKYVIADQSSEVA